MLVIHFEKKKKKTEKWWRRSKKERRERCQMSSGWHSSKLKNSRHGRLIVLARGCTTILSLSLLLSSPSSSSPLPSFSWVFCYCWDASALQSIWCLEALWNYRLSLCNWLPAVNCLMSLHLSHIHLSFYLFILPIKLFIHHQLGWYSHASWIFCPELNEQYGVLKVPLLYTVAAERATWRQSAPYCELSFQLLCVHYPREM